MQRAVSFQKNHKMTQLIAAQARKARKDRPDNSSEFIIESMDWIRLGKFPSGLRCSSIKMTFSELRSIAQLKANNWKIKKGQTYIKQFCKQEGQTYSFYTLPDILRICIKYKIYGDDSHK